MQLQEEFKASCRCGNSVEFSVYPSDEYHGVFCIDMDRGTVRMVQEGAMVRLDFTCEDCWASDELRKLCPES